MSDKSTSSSPFPSEDRILKNLPEFAREKLTPVNILLVDDEARNLDVLESLLHSPEYNLVRALTAERALMLLLEGVFAAIVLDIQMPGMTGIELAALIKQRRRTRHIPIIFLTAYFQEDKDVLQGYGSGAVDYLTKPVNPQILRSKIAVFVDLFRKTQALALANEALELEIAQREKAEEALRHVNNALEARVAERTADLRRVNAELVEREKDVAAARDQALAASRAKDDFLAQLSHELRTPLNPVLLLASEAATNPELPPDVRADFETIAQNVTLEARLIDDLLDLTAIARGKIALHLRPVRLHAVLRDALAMVRQDIAQKHLDVVLRLEAQPDTVAGDDTRLKQIFWNVFKNAVKFTPPQGRVFIASAVQPDTGRLTVTVTDTGIGLTAEESARIFAAFTQGDHAAHGGRRFGGLGLGLAISRMLVHLHAGTITATSAGRDRGATFTIELPLSPDTVASAAPGNGVAAGGAAVAATDGLRPPLRILLIEDHQPTCRTLTELLARRRHRVVVANSVEEARTAAAGAKFDLVISDVGLPDGNGCDLMTELREKYGLMGVALTGYGMDDDLTRCRAAGFATHLTKPLSVRALDQALSLMAVTQPGR